MKIKIDSTTAMIVFVSESISDARDLGRLAEILKVDAVLTNGMVELQCTAGQMMAAFLNRRK